MIPKFQYYQYFGNINNKSQEFTMILSWSLQVRKLEIRSQKFGKPQYISKVRKPNYPSDPQNCFQHFKKVSINSQEITH